MKQHVNNAGLGCLSFTKILLEMVPAAEFGNLSLKCYMGSRLKLVEGETFSFFTRR